MTRKLVRLISGISDLIFIFSHPKIGFLTRCLREWIGIVGVDVGVEFGIRGEISSHLLIIFGGALSLLLVSCDLLELLDFLVPAGDEGVVGGLVFGESLIEELPVVEIEPFEIVEEKGASLLVLLEIFGLDFIVLDGLGHVEDELEKAIFLGDVDEVVLVLLLEEAEEELLVLDVEALLELLEDELLVVFEELVALLQTEEVLVGESY